MRSLKFQKLNFKSDDVLTRLQMKHLLGGDGYGENFCCAVTMYENGAVIEECEEATEAAAAAYCEGRSEGQSCSYSCGNWTCGS